MPLHLAAKNRTEAVKTLITAGADVNARNNNGETPLHCAVYEGSHKKEAIKILIAAGADVNMKGNDGITPLQMAIKEDNPEIAEILREAGAKEQS